MLAWNQAGQVAGFCHTYGILSQKFVSWLGESHSFPCGRHEAPYRPCWRTPTTSGKNCLSQSAQMAHPAA